MKENTHSLWAWLNQPEEKKKYLNPLYSHNPLVIWPSVEPQSIQLWQGELGPALRQLPFSKPKARAVLARRHHLGWVACGGLGKAALLFPQVTHNPLSPRLILPMDPSLPVPR